MDLRQLRCFVTVAEERHFTRAAEKLGIAQPHLTQQIKALERELGHDLFIRSTRRVELTEPGRAFAEDAREILARLPAAVARTRHVARGLVGRLRVGFTESASFHPLVTESLRAFRTAFPEVELEIEENISTRLAAALESGALDAAFVRPPLQEIAAVAAEPVASEAMVAALPKDHPLARRAALSLDDLREERFVIYRRPEGPGLADELREACEAAGLSVRVAQETPQLSSTIAFVAAGLGVSVVPEGMTQVRPQSVAYVPIADLALRARLILAYRENEAAPAARNFIAVARGLNLAGA
jgi:DNA-binding transcriptional LysR family regulator